MKQLTFVAHCEADTDALGAALAAALPPRSVVALEGTLGAGKTRLVQAIAAAAGVDRRDVVSPTFVLLQTYRGDRLLHHLDAYRITSDEEFLELGSDELFASEAIVLVEWAERVRGCLPEERLEIHITVTGETERRFELVPHGGAYVEAVDRLSATLGTSASG